MLEGHIENHVSTKGQTTKIMIPLDTSSPQATV